MHWKTWARKQKNEMKALYLAFRDKRTPWYAKVFTAVVVIYALSPVDLIPDFIPVLGYLDDLILVPFGFLLAKKMIPREVLDECRQKVKDSGSIDSKYNRIGLYMVIGVWMIVTAAILIKLLIN